MWCDINNSIIFKPMKKITFSILALVLCILPLSATYRNLTEAQQIAIRQISENISSGGRQKSPSNINLQHVYTLKENNSVEANGLVYVFNKGENNGFVVVSGSDKANGILGYASTGTFDADKIPDGLIFWLNGFAEEIKLLEETSERNLFIVSDQKKSRNQAPSSSQFSSSISPLLGGIKWNQGVPYNNLCPVIPGTSNRAVTGCVATGMAQVMKYHQWPVSGTGSNSYTSKTKQIPLSVDFSTTTYDWANMTNVYNTSSTETQKTAIATLMYHCGVSTNMDYDESSGTSTSKMAKALINHFGYDANLNLIRRDFYTRGEWINLLKTELNASRPVLYGGQSETGGHLFVCDGYDSNDFFHFNWGWGGMSDGYYALTALNPSSQGIGGNSGGYNSYQDIVVGMQKPNPSTVPVYNFNMQESLSVSQQSVLRNGTTTVYINKIFNLGVNIFTGNLVLGLYSNNNLIAILKNFAINNLNTGYGYNMINAENITIPSGVANGTYKLYAMYKASYESNWTVVRSLVGTPNYLNVQVSDSEVTYTNADDFGPALSLNNLSLNGSVYQNKTGRFVVEISNTGKEYNSKLGVYLQHKTQPSIYQLITEDANIATNETATYYFNKTITLDPGEYYLAAMYDPDNIRANASTLSQIGSSQTIYIQATPTEPPVFSLTSQVSFPDNNAVNKEHDVLTANIINTGGYFENKMIAFVFPLEGGSSLTYVGYQDVFFDPNEQKNVTFDGNINLVPNQYQIITYYRDGTAWVRLLPTQYSKGYFTIKPEFTDIESIPQEIGQLQLYPNPAFDHLTFNADNIVDDIFIYQLDGKLIQKYSPKTKGNIRVDISNIKIGNYLLQINTAGKIQIGQFIKK